MALGTAVNLRTKIKDIYFMPTSEQLIINPSLEESALFKLAEEAAATLYETLPHTPVRAVGYNFSYELERKEDFLLDVGFTPSKYKDLFKSINAKPGDALIVQFPLALEEDKDAVLNLTLKVTGVNKALSMNYHYQVDGDPEKTKRALNKFHKNYLHSKALQSSLIKGD